MIYKRNRTKAYLEFKRQMTYTKSFEVLHHFAMSVLNEKMTGNWQIEIKDAKYGRFLGTKRYNNLVKNHTEAKLTKLIITSSFSIFEEYCKRLFDESFEFYFRQMTLGLKKEEKRVGKKLKDLKRYFAKRKQQYRIQEEREKVKELVQWMTCKKSRLDVRKNCLVLIFTKQDLSVFENWYNENLSPHFMEKAKRVQRLTRNDWKAQQLPQILRDNFGLDLQNELSFAYQIKSRKLREMQNEEKYQKLKGSMIIYEMLRELRNDITHAPFKQLDILTLDLANDFMESLRELAQIIDKHLLQNHFNIDLKFGELINRR